MPGFREILIRQGSYAATNMVSESIRSAKPKLDKEPYKEPDRPALRAAEQLLGRSGGGTDPQTGEPLDDPMAPVVIPPNLFDPVEGHDALKTQLLMPALRAAEPVHVLLVGEPGCGKTELLKCIVSLPRSRYAVGGATSSSGLLDYLLEKPSTRYLVIDELDKAEQADLYALYSLMESGFVTRLQHGAQQHEKRKVWVFAAANSADRIPDALLSRFVRADLPVYSQAEAAAVTARVLEREGLPAARAKQIAAATSARSRDPRDGIQVGRLAGPSGPIEPMIDQVIAR